MVTRRWVALAAAYLTVRLLIAGAQAPRLQHPDSGAYSWGVSFIGNQARPWVVPLIQWALPVRGVVLFQAALSALAFVVFAWAISRQLADRRVRIGLTVVVLLIGLAPRVTVYDLHLLSESVALSLTLLLVAALVHIDRVRPWVPIAVFTAWVFTRDANMYLGVLVVVGVALWSRRTDAA